MITVRWDTGGETSLIPGPGVLSVVTSQQRTRSAHTRPTTSGATAAARKTSAAGSQSGVARKAASGKKAALSKKAAPGKRPVAEKAPGGRKPMAKGTSSSRTTGKKTR